MVLEGTKGGKKHFLEAIIGGLISFPTFFFFKGGRGFFYKIFSLHFFFQKIFWGAPIFLSLKKRNF